MEPTATIHSLVGDLEYPGAFLLEPAAHAGSTRGGFAFHGARRIEPGHDA